MAALVILSAAALGLAEREAPPTKGRTPPGEKAGSQRLRVLTVTPHKGGIQRTSSQPATIEAFSFADLYPKVSGNLKKQTVDIGDSVREGEVIAEIDAPEFQKALNQAEATLAKARTQVALTQAKVQTAKAEAQAAAAEVKQTEAELVKATAFLEFRSKQYERIKALFERKSIEERLVDEKEEEREAARGAEQTARAAILTAKAQAASAEARVVQAVAAVDDAKSDVQVAEANVAKAAVFVEYTRIVSPYTGVVTRRSYHVGDFIRAAEEGGTTPVLTVARTDVMRVVVLVPERDAAFTDPGDPAVVELDAVPDAKFRGKVARIANSEDRVTRSMRTEIDLKNTSKRLRDGMFGHVTIYLSEESDRMTVPATSVVQVGNGKTAVFLVRDGKAHRQIVKAGRNDGIRVEIHSGLAADSLVIERPSEDLVDGTPVEAVDADTLNEGAKAGSGDADGKSQEASSAADKGGRKRR